MSLMHYVLANAFIIRHTALRADFWAPGRSDRSANGRSRRRISAQIGRALLALTAKPVPTEELKRSAIVFSPHPDDESLGCGGTIIRKIALGASVKVVQMTDGGASHNHIMPEETLTRIRLGEAKSAGNKLGLAESDMYFLAFPDTRLRENMDAAVERVADLLSTNRPEEVFVPHSREPLSLAPDHLATTRIVRAALARCGMSVAVWEYPVWFWMHWPWVSLSNPNPGNSPPVASYRNSLRLLFGVRALMDLGYSVNIGDVLEQKRAALSQHRSQMERISPDARWITLSDVSGGEFLRYFCQECEFFRRYRYCP